MRREVDWVPTSFLRQTFLLWAVFFGGALSSRAPVPPRLQLPERAASNVWRLRWATEPGVRYRLDTTASPGDGTLWSPLATLQADGAQISYDDTAAGSGAARFYRLVIVSDSADATPPTLANLRVAPASVTADGTVVELSVEAREESESESGVAGVDFLSSGAVIGAASRIEADRWRLLWSVGFDLNGTRPITARARDGAGNTATTPTPVTLAVAIPARQVTKVSGVVTLGATSFAAGAGGTWVPQGTLRLGLASSESSGAILDPAANRLTGNGSVTLAGVGLVATGPFTVDTATGWLRGMPPATVTLHPLLLLRAAELEANVNSGALRGRGLVEVTLGAAGSSRALQGTAPDTNGLAVLDGAFESNPTNQTLHFVGRATYRDVTLVGEGSVNLADAVLELAGTLRVPGVGGANYELRRATMKLVRNADAEPEFELAGEPSEPALVALEVRLTGKLQRNGALSLATTTAGRLDALRFTTLRVTLERAGLPGATAFLAWNGSLELPRVGGTALRGGLLPGGAMTNVVSTEPVAFGALRVRPLAPGQPVLRMLASVGDRETFQVRGEFLTPEENGTRPVEVTGPLVLVTRGATLDVESLRLTNALPIPNWPLPQSLRVTNFSLVLSLTNENFEARMRGQLKLTREARQSTNDPVLRPTLLGFDTALAVNLDDAENLGFDTAVRAEKIPLLSIAYLRDATFRLTGGTKPLRAGLGIIDGTLGLFPKYTLEPAAPGRDDFRLSIERVGARIEFVGERFSAQVTNGTLVLPALFTNLPPRLCPDQPRSSIGLGTNSAITLDFDPLPEPSLTIRATGLLDFHNLAFSPGFAGFGAELCRASLAFNPGGLPYLTNLQGTVQIPLPPGETNRIALIDGAWELDGWPSGTLALMSDARLYDKQGLAFTLLGRTNSSCPIGTALTVKPGEGLAPRTLVLDGGMRVDLPADLVTEVQGDRVSALVCARLTLPAEDPPRPQLELRNVEFAGNFHLGGVNGLQVTNAVLSLQNLEHVFDLATNRPVIVRVSGTVSVGNLPSLTLNDARFTFFDPERPPRFDLAGMGYDERQFPLAQKIPARLTKASFTFDNREAPLDRLFHPTNINLKVSGVLAFPTTGNPLFETSFDDAVIDIGEKGAAVFKGLDGLAMTLRGLDLPPMSDIGGKIFASGLAGGAPAGPQLQGLPGLPGGDGFDVDNLFLAGRVAGSYQGYKINLLIAFRITGMVGVCLDFNAGNAGIPLDGGSLGGILLTGASGGMAFGTGFIDPCEFTSYLGPDGKPKPGVTELPPIVLDWEDLRKKLADAEAKYETFKGYLPGGGGTTTNAPSGGHLALAGPQLASFLPHARYTNDFGLPCPGDCPPPTINLFCQPHPDQEQFPRRIIARFSSIDEPTLNRLGFTRDAVHARFASGAAAVADLPGAVARAVRTEALARTPLPDPAVLGPQAATIRGYIDEALDQLEQNLTTLLRTQLGAAAVAGADPAYDAVRDTVYAGAPCPDLTLSVSGTLTHTVVSSFLSGTVGVVVSTAGSAGVSGRVNVFGVPVGRAKGFVSATDDHADPNPALCAEVEVSVGPFELGTMRGSYAIGNAVTASGRVFERLTSCLGDALFGELVQSVAPQIRLTQRTRVQIAAEMSASERLGFIAQLYSRPGLPAELRTCFRDGLAALLADIQPEILLCAQIQPKLFGFDLGQSLVDGGMHVTKTEFTSVGSYSPSLLMATALLAGSSTVGGGVVGALAGPVAATLFAPDHATYGISYRITDPLELFVAGLDGQMQSPQALAGYLDRQFDALLENATYTFAYSLSPLGFKTTDAQMRVVIPNLTAHPAFPGSGWVRPEARVGAGLPSRLDLVLSALTNHLSGSSLGLVADPQWRGTATDLGEAFPVGSAARTAVAGLSFAKDYFPHGGVVGGAYVQIPRALYEAPAPELRTALNPEQDLLTRLSAAVSWIQDYVLVSRQAGALGFYLPAPNPPVFTDAHGALLSPRALLTAIRQRELNELDSPGAYPASEMFLKGWIDGQLLGIPIARGDLEAALADAQAGTEGLFRARAQVPAGSWLDAFSPGARVEFELRQSPSRPIQDTFQARLLNLRALLAGQPTQAVMRAALEDYLRELTNGLPKVKLEAELPLQFPAAVRSVAEFTGGTWLYAYSPRYEPGYAPADTQPRARARRDGGLAFRGSLNLRALGKTVASLPTAELVVIPRSSGPPSVAGEFDLTQFAVPGLALRSAHVSFTSDPVARLVAAGETEAFALGVFRVESTTGGALGGRIAVAADAAATGGTAVDLRLRPGRIRLLTGFANLYGATPTNDFTFSSTGPWNATVEVGSTLTLAAAGVTLAELESAALVSPVRLDAVGTTSGTVTADLRGGSTLRFFPGRSYAQVITLGGGSAARVIVRSDGTFEVTGTTARALNLASLPGLSIARLESGSTFRLTQDGFTATGQAGGGVLESVGGPTFTLSATLTLARDGTVGVTAAGGVTVPALTLGSFVVDGANGGPIAATLNSAGLLLTGARVRFERLMTNALSSFTLDRAGNFRVAVGPTTSGFGPFTFSEVQYQLIRTNGVLTVTNYVGRWGPLSLGEAVELRGFLTSAGQIALTNSTSAASLAGYSVGPLELRLQRGVASLETVLASQAARAWWSFNEISGTTAINRVSAANPGAYVSPVVFSPKDVAVDYEGNAAVRFSGGYLNGGKGTELANLSTGFSAAAWVKVAAFDHEWNTIVSKGDSAWRVQRDGTRAALAFDTDGLNPPYLAGTRSVDDGRWHHVVATYDGRAKSLWIDGELDAWTPATGTIAANVYPVLVGENAQSTGRRWNGWIDEVALFDRALRVDEILAQYQAGGGLSFDASARLTAGGLAAELHGTLSGNGGVALSVRRDSASFGGFVTQDARVQLLRAPGGAASVQLDGTLNLAGVPAARLSGNLNAPATFDLQGSLASGAFGPVTLADLAFRLQGTAGQVRLGMDGALQVAGLGVLPLSGQVFTDGTLALTNALTAASTLFDFPVRAREHVLRRQPTDYRVAITGEPLVLSDLGSDPVAYWRLDETTGTTVNDGKKVSRLRPALAGTFVGGPTLGQAGALAGPANGRPAVRFDGVDDYVQITDETSFDFASALSVVAWVKVAAWTRDWQALVTKGDSSWRLSRFSNTRRVSFDTTSAAGSHSLPGTVNLDDGAWHQVVAVYDGRAKFLYVDGALDAFAIHNETLNRNDAPVMIGENAEARGRYFNGWLDEVAVYNRALTPVDVGNQFLAGGGIVVAARATLGLNGVQEVALSGMLHPRGAASLTASVASQGLFGFTLNNAFAGLHRVAGAGAVAQWAGGVNTPFGAATFNGLGDALGNYTLESTAVGAWTIGNQTFAPTGALKLTRSSIEGAGSMTYGGLSLSGTVKIPAGGGAPSFSGSAANTTPKLAFGKQLDGSPGHPYAWAAWRVSGSYNAATRTVGASVSGTLTVEYEVPRVGGSDYPQKDFSFGPLSLGTDGAFKVIPGGTFNGVSTFGFTIP